jgi:hypothetical protein
MLTAGYIHREDRLLQSVVNEKMSLTTFVGASFANFYISATLVALNIGALALVVMCPEASLLRLAVATGTGGILGPINLFAEEAFNNAVYGDEYSTPDKYKEAASEGAFVGAVFSIVEMAASLGKLRAAANYEAQTYEELLAARRLTDRRTVVELNHKPTSGAVITTIEGKTTTVIGAYEPDLKYILNELSVPVQTGTVESVVEGFSKGNPGGLNFLNVSDSVFNEGNELGGFFETVNAAWIDAAVTRGDEIIVVSALEHRYKLNGARLSGFGKEVERLTDIHGYKWNFDRTRLHAPNK